MLQVSILSLKDKRILYIFKKNNPNQRLQQNSITFSWSI